MCNMKTLSLFVWKLVFQKQVTIQGQGKKKWYRVKGPVTRNIHVIYENFISSGLKVMAKVSFLQKQVKVRSGGREVKNYGTMWRSCHKGYSVKHEQWQSYNQKKSVTDVRKLRLTDGRAGGQKDKLQTQWSLGGVLLRCRHKNWRTFLVNKVMIFRIRVQNHQKMHIALFARWKDIWSIIH